MKDGRLLKAHLVEDTKNLIIGTTSFLPGNWECLNCQEHFLLPRKRSQASWDQGGRLIILADQNMPPILPFAGKTCPAVIRVEGGSLGELGDSLCTLLGDYTIPTGSVIAIGSLSHLQKSGIASYTDKLVTEVRRFNSMFHNKVMVVPFVPLPLCGTDDPELSKLILDLSLYMDIQENNCHLEYNAKIRTCIMEQILECGVLVDHGAAGKSLPITLSEHEQRLYQFGGHSNLPASLSPLSVSAEEDLLSLFLSGIHKVYRIRMEAKVTVSRSLPLVPEDKKLVTAIVVGGSNAVNLNSSIVARGGTTISIATGGWIVNAINVNSISPALEGHCGTVDKDVPVVLYLLDSSAFKCSDIDGEIIPISKKADGTYHVVGSLEVAPEVSMRAVIFNLIKLIKVCGNRKVILLTPLPRYINAACCNDVHHCTHLQDPDCGIRICCDLHRLIISLRNQLREVPNCTVIVTGDVISGKANAAPSDVLAATADWGAVHGPKAAYDKIARYVLDFIRENRAIKRTRDEPVVFNSDGSQRSRGASFSDGVAALGRGGPRNHRPGGQSFPFPPIGRGSGRRGNSTSYY
jgi:hypothetical protein